VAQTGAGKHSDNYNGIKLLPFPLTGRRLPKRNGHLDPEAIKNPLGLLKISI
jgi:hypothetical protein